MEVQFEGRWIDVMLSVHADKEDPIVLSKYLEVAWRAASIGMKSDSGGSDSQQWQWQLC